MIDEWFQGCYPPFLRVILLGLDILTYESIIKSRVMFLFPVELDLSKLAKYLEFIGVFWLPW